MNKCSILTILLIAFYGVLYTGQRSPAHAAEPPQIRIGFGQSRPPFIYDNYTEGLEIELIHRLVKEMGYAPQSTFLPNARGYTALKNKNVDIYTTATQNLADEFHLSDPYMSFDNVLISKASTDRHIAQLSDIRGARLAAFQGAHFLVKGIEEIKDSLSLYIETPIQSRQIQLLYKDRVDYLFSEKKIFEYNLKRAVTQGEIAPVNLDYKIYNIMPRTLYSAAFNDPLLRDKFNIALRALIESGHYQQINQKYDSNFHMPTE